MNTITLLKPDDFHLHLRDGEELAAVVGDSARRFARAIVMPNLIPPVVSVAQALDYRHKILTCLPDNPGFEPLMTLYLTDDTSRDEVDRVAETAGVYAFKYYPAGATTHSASGVTHIDKVMPLLEYMAQRDVPLLVHGEVTDADVDVFDREKVFIERVLAPLAEQLESLRIVFEHVTTAEAVQFVRGASGSIAATITPHHLLLNRNAMLSAGLNPHHYCLPVLKRERHRQALVDAATSGNPKFFLGTDSAPHDAQAKEKPPCCAGIYNAHAAIELYASVFDAMDSLDTLERFAARNGAHFYGLPLNTQTITLRREPWCIPKQLSFADGMLIPFRAGELCPWRLVDELKNDSISISCTGASNF